MTRKGLLLTLCLTLSMLLVASVVSAQTRISFWHGYNEIETQALEERVLPLFHAQYPNIEVTAVRMGYDDLRDRIVTTSLSDAGPDVARLDIIWTPGFAASGLLEPLGGYEGFDAIKDELYPGPLSTNQYQGEYYGLPLTTNTQVYVYNNTLFEQAALTAPRTFSEFYDVSRRLTRVEADRTTRYGYDTGGPWNWTLLPWIWSNGGDLTDPAITTASGYLDGSGTVGMLDMLNEWHQAGILAPNIAGEGFDGWGSFVNGVAAARQDGPWFATWLEEHHPEMDVGYSLMPAASGQTSTSVVGGENIVIGRGSRDKDAAWTFVRFMLSYDAQSIMATTGQIPVIRSATMIPEFMDSPYYPVYLEQLLTAKARTPHPRYADMENVVQDAYQRILRGETGAFGALSEATRLVNEMLVP